MLDFATLSSLWMKSAHVCVTFLCHRALCTRAESVQGEDSAVA